MDFLKDYAGDMLWITSAIVLLAWLGLKMSKRNSDGEDSPERGFFREPEGSFRESFQNLTKIYTAHNNAEADLIKSFLGQHEINAFIRGYAHRSLLGFVGPYVELDVLVPEEQADEALKIIEDQLKEGRRPRLSIVRDSEETSARRKEGEGEKKE